MGFNEVDFYFAYFDQLLAGRLSIRISCMIYNSINPSKRQLCGITIKDLESMDG